MLRMYAVSASIASTSRKSSVSSVTLSFSHVAPPSVVRSTVDPDPLAQATCSFTALTPRNRAVTPLVCVVQRGVASIVNRETATRSFKLTSDSAFSATHTNLTRFKMCEPHRETNRTQDLESGESRRQERVAAYVLSANNLRLNSSTRYR